MTASGDRTEKVVPGVATGVDLQSLFDALAHVCEQLEGAKRRELTLEESMKLYEEGVRLERIIQAELNKTERHMVMILDADGVESPFESTNQRGSQLDANEYAMTKTEERK